MKLHRCLLPLVAFCLAGPLVAEVRADGYLGRTGLPWFAYGYSGSLYGLGRLPVPPYYAIHPPVYYSLPQARPYGYSPFAYSGNYQPPAEPARRLVRNPFIEDAPLPEPAQPQSDVTTSTARLIANPFYSANDQPGTRLASQTE